MTDIPADGDNGAAARSQDPIVERLRPDPTAPPTPSVELHGFLGDSDRPGRRRLYLTPDLDYCAEFQVGDVLHISDVAAERDPFPGEQSTRVVLRRDAAVDYVRTRRAQPPDDWDLDVQVARPAFGTQIPELLCGTGGDVTCGPNTPQSCQETCQTCATDCGTCETNCGTCAIDGCVPA